MEALLSDWMIPRDFLDLQQGKVVGKGRFGSVLKGTVNLQGRQQAAIVVQVPSGKSAFLLLFKPQPGVHALRMYDKCST